MDKNYIEVARVSTETYEHTGETTREDELEIYFAVRPSPDRYRNYKDGDTPPDWSSYGFTASWRLNGGMSVEIWSKQDIEGYRALLDAIEADLNEQEKKA